MKKVILMCALMVSSVSMATPSDPEVKIEAGKAKMITALVGGALSAMACEQISAEWMPYAVAKGTQLTTTLMSLGLAFDKPELRDAAVRVPVILMVSQLAEVSSIHQIAEKLPFGIGDALKATGEKATTALLSILTYKYVADPLLAMFLYKTKMGQMMVGVPVAAAPAK